MESMTLVDLKSVMKFNNIPIRHLNKSEIIDVLLNTPNVDFEVRYDTTMSTRGPASLQGARESSSTRRRAAPKSNIRNSARRVKLTSADGASGLTAGDTIFPSIYEAARFLGYNSNQTLYCHSRDQKIRSKLDPIMIYSIEILD